MVVVVTLLLLSPQILTEFQGFNLPSASEILCTSEVILQIAWITEEKQS